MKGEVVKQGFTLIQISILLIVASLVLVAVLPSGRSNLDANQSTANKLNAVLTALRGYEAAHAALPCPADAGQPIGSTSYGVSSANPGTGSPGNCTGGSPAANYSDAANNVAVGMVPVRALGLSNDYALDAFGRDITYAVDTNATVCFSGTLPGKITVTDNGTANSTIAALVSHGTDGHGAWVPLTGNTGAAVRLNAGATDTNELLNAHVNSSFAATTPLTNFVRSPPTTTFDDLLVYKSNLWTLNTAPAASASLLPSVSPPANGTYATGQSVTFLITYGNTVSVTGTPRLTLSIPQSGGGTATRYANYVSSSGNTATFTYTVQSTDYAPTNPSSVSLSSPISLNGGTMAVGGGAACLSFTPPSLTGVLLNPTSVYVVDYNNNLVQKFDGHGNFLLQFGGAGSGNGKFNSPAGITVDKNGNVWVGDIGNCRVEEFDASGNYVNKFGNCSTFNWIAGLASDSTGNIWVVDWGWNQVDVFNSSGVLQKQFGGGSGGFSHPFGITLGATNVWVTDHDNNRVQKFDLSGNYQSKFGGSGAGNGQFNSPDGIAADANGNLWVVDENNDRMQEFSASGSYLSKFGSYGHGNGLFDFTHNYVAIDSSGDMWISDTGNNLVQVIDSCGTFQMQFGGAGSGNGTFNGPSAIAIFPNSPGGSYGACIASITPPSNGAYSTGQALTFTVTYNQAVTVTGTPRLTLTIGGNTRYANYLSGSGTTTLTFTYTIVAGDTATGIAVASLIDLNGGSITSGGTSASLSYTAPSMSGITINSAAYLLVADSSNNRVQKFDLVGNYITQFGAAGSGNGQFNHPSGTAIDSGGNIWVADGGNNRVQKFNKNGTYLTQFGTSGTGNGQFNNASQLSIDGSGNLWVSDYSNNRIQEFNSSGVYQSQFGSAGSGNGQFSGPDYIHFDFSGNIYVSEWLNSRVQKFNTSGTWLAAFGPSVANYGTMNGVDAHVIDSCRNIWIEDENNNTMVELDYAGNFVSSFSDSGGMQGLAIDANQNLYVLDAISNIVNIYNSSGTLTSSFGSAGSGNGQFNAPADITVVGSAPSSLPLSSCPAVILSAAGPTSGIYTTGGTLGFAVTYDQAVSVAGTPYINITIGANTRQASYVSGSGTATLTFQYTVTAADNAPNGITMNAPVTLGGGTLTSNTIHSHLYFQPPSLTGVLVNPVSYSDFYIADTSNHVVRKVTSSTGFISTYAGTGTSGSTNDNNNSAATSAKLNSPKKVVQDSSGNLYISDSGNHTILKVTQSTGKISIFAGTGTSGSTNDNNGSAATSAQLAAPTGLAIDSSNNIYIGDTTNHTVLKVTAATGIISTIGGTAGSSGTTNENNGSLATAALLNAPSALAVDSSNNVYIADSSNHVVMEITSATGKIAYYAGTGVSGSSNDNNNSAATSAKLNSPKGVAVDSSGNIYIADSGNQTILKVSAATGKIAVVAGTTGSANYTGDGAAATSATLHAPAGVGIDASANIYIADSTNNVIRFVSALYANISTIAGNSTSGYSGDGGAATSAEINAPIGVGISR
ncbi:MAG: SMP-30/gluconolactonase/LRE family protein [Acidobacteriia bacterium]|nr:SMP-30/gluconolactonase/LRE family protein [Terriglobia bacterium]